MTYVQNIISRYLLATDAEVESGSHWYDRARDLATELSPDDVWRGAGVIASFSPRMPWSRNVTCAVRTFETGIASGSTRMFNSFAQRIHDGEHTLEVLKGDKTRAFASAIADPNCQLVTIDAHAFDIAYAGARIPEKDRPNLGKRLYRDISAAYVQAGAWTGFMPYQIQAISWVAHRRIIGCDWRDDRG